MPDTDILIREFDPQCDTEALSKIDTSFVSERVYRIEKDGSLLRLSLTPANPSITKSLPMELDADSWTHAFVAVAAGVVQGFIATTFRPWNRRLVIAHFYVNRPFRKQGIGRQLMDHALQQSESMDAATAWIETNNLNYPAVETYRRLGFSLCGFDATYYQGTLAEGEFALFLARPL